MSPLLPVLLWVLAVTDAAFCGFRDAAGRDARIFKAEYYRRAVRRGLRAGALATLWIGGGVAIVLATAPEPGARYVELLACARVMLWILVPYATLVLIGLGVWAMADADLRTLGSVILLGPFTLIRPWVIAFSGGLAAWKAPSLAAGGVAIGACLVQLGIEPWLGRRVRVHPSTG